MTKAKLGAAVSKGTGVLLAAACLLTPTGTAAGKDLECVEAVLPTADSLRRQRGRVVVFGETHGTQESPALVGDLACHLAVDGRVLVGIELPRWLDEDIAAFVAGELDVATLTTAERPVMRADGSPLAGSEQQWWQETRDGRSSRAMLGLLTRVRELVRSGLEVETVAFDDASLWFEGEEEPANTREELMATNVARKWGAGDFDYALMLTGGFHARRSPEGRRRTMVDWLPADDVFSVHIRFRRGAAWTCRLSREGALPANCGAHALPETLGDGPLLTLTPLPSADFDAEILLPAANPSPPAVSGDGILRSTIK
ncbi:MAG: hypothetical protein OXG82_00545 [Gammaproteobacteria bacterium]|nr:hypothetical protein [Gammaproteobacteria bacterium]